MLLNYEKLKQDFGNYDNESRWTSIIETYDGLSTKI